VAEQGSFAAAARRLGRSPTAVTRTIAELEARLGVRLLNRTTRAVSLTDPGRRLLAGAKRVLADLDEIERAAAGEGTAPRGELRLTAPILFGRLHVEPLVLEFLRRFPDVSVALTLIDRPVDLIEDGLDAAVRIGVLPESSSIATRVGTMRRLDVGIHSTIAFSGLSGAEHWTFREGRSDISVAVKPRLTVNTAEAALDAARTGFGLTRVMGYQAADDIARGSLVRLLKEYESEELPIHVVYPGGRHPPPKLRAFLDFVIPRLRQRCDAIARAIETRA
jgi:DNA-binding transcriptional LysR family regulator